MKRGNNQINIINTNLKNSSHVRFLMPTIRLVLGQR